MKIKREYYPKPLKKGYCFGTYVNNNEQNVVLWRNQNGQLRKRRIANRQAHEHAIIARRKFGPVKWPARFRKKYCKTYIHGSLYI